MEFVWNADGFPASSSSDPGSEATATETTTHRLIGLSNGDTNTTREDIERYNLREVRMDTYQKWYEMLMNPITSLVSIQRRTLIVEGNP